MSKMTALEAYKLKIVTQDMNIKLGFLESLKNNMGEEMAEMMSEEITKVMDEQRDLELEYAQLVQQRDQLKGISNKHKLMETKEAIMTVAKELKESTRKLCRQLQKKPDVEGNQQQVAKHKKDLIVTIERVQNEMEKDLTFANFTRMIKEEMAEADRYEQLKDKERKLNAEILEVSVTYKKLRNEFAKENDENQQEIIDLKQRVNETLVEKELHEQYLTRQLQGRQSMFDRNFLKQETLLNNEIAQLREQLETEVEVSETVKAHLRVKRDELNKMSKEREDKREKQVAELEKEKEDIKTRKRQARDDFDEFTKKILLDDDERRKRAEIEKAEEDEEEAKIKEKMSMEDAARYIQGRWKWFQEEGKFLAKKGKKGRKGKKGKKGKK